MEEIYPNIHSHRHFFLYKAPRPEKSILLDQELAKALSVFSMLNPKQILGKAKTIFSNPPLDLQDIGFYRSLLYVCTALTGGVSLLYQIVWQRYLSILVGSEARSISLVVAVFLLGLACGYHSFGRLSQRNWKRFQLLRIYGYVELLTAIYALLFPFFFQTLTDHKLQRKLP